MYCQPTDHWSVCAQRTKKAINDTKDPAVALAAASEWADRYRALYFANAQASWTSSDQDRMNDAMEKLWDESIGKYLDPLGIVFDAALKRYAPKLAAIVGWMSGPAAVVFYGLLAPSPLANDFTQAKHANDEISRLFLSKLPAPTQEVIQIRFTPYVNDAYQKCMGARLP